MIDKLSLREEGIQIVPNFLSNEMISALQVEAGNLFRFTQILGLAYCVRLNKFLCELPNPEAHIQSQNLLEMAIDIHDKFSSLGYENYKLTHIAMYREIGNSKPLLWHSDLREGGLIRAQICVSGGQLDSGAFRYVKGSNRLEITEANWEPSSEYMNSQHDNIITCNVPNGSLVLINTLGYHGKCPCVSERISIMFDFLPITYIDQTSGDIVGDYYLTTSRLTQKVIDNISLFRTGIPTTVSAPNTPDGYKFFKPFAGSNMHDIFAVLPIIFSKIIGKLGRKLRCFLHVGT